MMNVFKKLFKSYCLCCGEIAPKDVNEILMGKEILNELIENNSLIVSTKRYEKISYRRDTHGPFARYPLCINCYRKVEEKWEEFEAESEEKRKEVEISEYYTGLAVEIERKELETRAKALGIDLDEDIIKLNTKIGKL